MSIRSTHARAPWIRALASTSGGALKVTTLRLWTASEWTSSIAAPVAKAPEISSILRLSRPSEKLGTPSSIRRRP